MGAKLFPTGLLSALIAGLLCFPSSLAAQTEEMEVADNVRVIQEQLKSPNFDERDEAEAEIIKLGSSALDHIDDPSEDYEADFNERLIRIRKALEKVAVQEAISPSRITLVGEVSLKKAFAVIKSQTGNEIALAEGYDPAFLEKKIKLNHEDASFWTVFADLQAKGGIESNLYGGVAGKAVVVPRGAVDPAMVDKAVAKVPPAPLDESGIFRLRVTGTSSAKNFLNPELDYTQVNLEIQWEPRLTPISIDMPLNKVKVLDENGKELKVSNPESVISGQVQPGINHVTMSIVLENVDRDVKKIGDITGRLDCILPGRREKFRFPPIGGIEGKPKLSKAGITVQYLGVEQNEDLFSVGLLVSMDTKAEEFDSHLGWIYDNPLFLINAAGKKEPSIGHQGGDVDENGVHIQYFYVDDPKELGLLYESPGAIVPLPADFGLKDIALP
jgi:hypothetical protein